MAQVNAALAEIFDGFAIWREDQFCDPAENQIRIEPLMHMSVAHALVAQGYFETNDGSTWTPWLVPEDSEPPPMRWLSAASRNQDHAQESWHLGECWFGFVRPPACLPAAFKVPIQICSILRYSRHAP